MQSLHQDFRQDAEGSGNRENLRIHGIIGSLFRMASMLGTGEVVNT